MWEAYLHKSFGWFQNLAGTIAFREEVDEAVVDQFKAVRKALLHSYFEYDLLEAAYDRALLSLEMALRRRYRELHPEVEDLNREASDEPYSLEGLLDWADEKNLLESTERRSTPEKHKKDDEHIAHYLRDMRNRVAHRERSARHGPIAINIIVEIVGLINHLYGDPEQRHRRHEMMRLAEESLQEVFDDRGVLSAPEEAQTVRDQPGNRMLIYEASVLYHDNRVDVPVTHFAFQPIFDPEKGGPDGVDTPAPVVVSAVSFAVADGFLEMKDTDGESWTFSPIQKEENQRMFSKWREQIDDKYDLALSSFGFAYDRLGRQLQAPEPIRSKMAGSVQQ
jgi:hypothetical protein